jgi:alcohol dehydrogenase class IV
MTKINTYLWPGAGHVGFGAAQLTGREAQNFRAKRAMVVSDTGIIAAGLLDPISQSLNASGISHTVYDAIPGNPDTGAVHAAAVAFQEAEADIIIAVGGGSVLDAAKGVRLLAGVREFPVPPIQEYATMLGDQGRPHPLRRGMPPMIAIPTTAGTGAEVTPWGLLTDLERKLKFGIGGDYLIPDVALVDPELTLTLPAGLTAATGLDALSHCIEAFVSTNANPLLDPLILQGITLIGRSLRRAVHEPDNREARQDMIIGSMLGGIAISSNWLGACHSLAHQLSSFADLHHGVAIALTLLPQMAFSLPAAPERYAQISAALRGEATLSPDPGRAAEAVESVRQLIVDTGLPTRLRDAGVDEALIPAMADHAYHLDTNWMSNPRPVTKDDLEALYRQAY